MRDRARAGRQTAYAKCRTPGCFDASGASSQTSPPFPLHGLREAGRCAARGGTADETQGWSWLLLSSSGRGRTWASSVEIPPPYPRTTKLRRVILGCAQKGLFQDAIAPDDVPTPLGGGTPAASSGTRGARSSPLRGRGPLRFRSESSQPPSRFTIGTMQRSLSGEIRRSLTRVRLGAYTGVAFDSAAAVRVPPPGRGESSTGRIVN
jgi:hypothetical protein